MYDLPLDKIKFIRLSIKIEDLKAAMYDTPISKYNYYFVDGDNYATLESLNGSDYLLNYTSDIIKDDVLNMLRALHIPFSVIGK